MLVKLCRFFQFSVILAAFALTVAEISSDYNFGDNLRTDIFKKKMRQCGSSKKKEDRTCEDECGPKFVIYFGTCLCVLRKGKPLDEDSQEEIERDTETDDSFSDFQDYTEMTPILRAIMPIAIYKPKPALRHHIAHFCPNLEVARQCIRKCMKLGKPAFCGKDHVCYCGHKYEYPIDDAQTVDPADAYGEFKDLYEKYFGPRDADNSPTGTIDMTTPAASESIEDTTTEASTTTEAQESLEVTTSMSQKYDGFIMQK